MKKRIPAVVMVLILLCGCAGGKEVESVAVAVGAGVDIIDGMTALTVETVDASGKDVCGKIYTSYGKNLSEAVSQMVTLTGKPLYWEHLKFMLISKYAIRDELENVMGRIMKSKQSRIALPIAVTDDYALKVLNSKPEGHPFVSDMIENEIEASFKSGLTVKTPAFMAYNGLYGSDKVTAFPYIICKDAPKVDGAVFVYDNLNSIKIDSDTCLVFNLLNGKGKSGIIESGGVSAGILGVKVKKRYTGSLDYDVGIKVSFQETNGLYENEATELLLRSLYDGFNKLSENFPGLKTALIAKGAPTNTAATAVFRINVKDSGQEK